MNRTPRSALSRYRAALSLGGVLFMGVVAPTMARPGYANLINSFCSARNAVRVTYTDNGCSLCHHNGTFSSDPEHRVEPQWTEFETGRATSDYSFFCPGDGTPALISADSDTAGRTPLAVAGTQTTMAWMALGYPDGHGATMRGDGKGQTAEATASATQAGSTSTALSATESLAPTSPDAQTVTDVHGKLAKLHADLGIDRAQEGAWQEVGDAVLAASARADAVSARLGLAVPLTDQLQRRQRQLAQRTAQLRAVNTAVVRLNAQLDAKRQRLLSARLPALIGEP